MNCINIANLSNQLIDCSLFLFYDYYCFQKNNFNWVWLISLYFFFLVYLVAVFFLIYIFSAYFFCVQQLAWLLCFCFCFTSFRMVLQVDLEQVRWRELSLATRGRDMSVQKWYGDRWSTGWVEIFRDFSPVIITHMEGSGDRTPRQKFWLIDFPTVYHPLPARVFSFISFFFHKSWSIIAEQWMTNNKSHETKPQSEWIGHIPNLSISSSLTQSIWGGGGEEKGVMKMAANDSNNIRSPEVTSKTWDNEKKKTNFTPPRQWTNEPRLNNENKTELPSLFPPKN